MCIGRWSLSATDLILSLFARFRIVAYVKNPFLAKVKAVSKPIPLELPVTTATFSLISLSLYAIIIVFYKFDIIYCVLIFYFLTVYLMSLFHFLHSYG